MSESWPPAPTSEYTNLTDTQAQRVRNKLNLDESVDVKVLSETFYGGYSEYTQENETTFTVVAGRHSIVFAMSGEEVFTDAELERFYSDTVYARMDAWLRLAESDDIFAQLFGTSPKESSGRYEDWSSENGTSDILNLRVFRRINGYPVTRYQLFVDNETQVAKLNAVGIKTDSGFTPVHRQWTIGFSSDDELRKEIISIFDSLLTD